MLLTTALLIALIATTTSLLLFGKLRATERELERTRSRMARLDEVANGLADLEYATTREEPRTEELRPQEPRVEKPQLQEPRRRRLDTPVTLTAQDSGQFAAIGLQFDTEDVFEDEPDFAPPQMASEPAEDRRQKPSRPRHQTPTGSPKTFAPRSTNSVVEVGSIQVRSDELTKN